MILVAQSEISLDKLADLPDKIIEVTEFSSLLAVNAASPSNDSLLEKIDALSNQVAKLSALIRRHSHSSSKVHSTDRACDSLKTRCNGTGWCWLHHLTLSSRTTPINALAHVLFRKPLPAVWKCSNGLLFSKRHFVTDVTTEKRFLIDTGSDVLCFPKRLLTGCSK